MLNTSKLISKILKWLILEKDFTLSKRTIHTSLEKKQRSGIRKFDVIIHAKTVLTEILSEKYASKGINVNSFHPGAVRSDLMQNMPWRGQLIGKLVSPFISKTSKTGIYVCSSPDIQGTSGKFFTNKKVINLNFKTSYKERLWKESENLIRGV